MVPVPTADAFLPQPPPSANNARQRPRRYAYVPYDVLESDWLGDPRRLIHILRRPASMSSSSSSSMMMRRAAGGNSGDCDDGGDDLLARYSPGTLVWVFLSKGRSGHPKNKNDDVVDGGGGIARRSGCGDALALHKKRRDKKNKRRIVDAANEKEDDDDDEIDGREGFAPSPNRGRKEFFLRARVVSDDEATSSSSIWDRHRRRVLVRYSGGSTYRVRACNLLPVLELDPRDDDSASPSPIRGASVSAQIDDDDGESVSPPHGGTKSASTSLPPLVVVVPETNIYRRVAKVHTAPGDSFVEIGCDYGITVERIRDSLEGAGDVPRDWPPPPPSAANVEEEEGGENADDDHRHYDEGRVSCLGVDKSKESIDIANQRYPRCKFVIGDVLVPGEMSSVRALCERHLVGSAPSVMCIDINGNREINGVLDCLRMVMNEPWSRMPRMIIVKSRFLYWEMKKMEESWGGW